jgi:hypothetical protein
VSLPSRRKEYRSSGGMILWNTNMGVGKRKTKGGRN